MIVRLGRDAAVRSTLARVGYLHESPAFPALPDGPGLPRLLRRPVTGDAAGTGGEDSAACWTKSASTTVPARRSPPSARACSSDWPWPRPWSMIPSCWCSTSRPRAWTSRPASCFTKIILRRKAQGKTAILVSHSMADVGRLCDELAVLRGGQVVFQGMLAELTGEGPGGGDVDSLQEALEPIYAGAAIMNIEALPSRSSFASSRTPSASRWPAGSAGCWWG